jgi:hypothetical protein
MHKNNFWDLRYSRNGENEETMGDSKGRGGS